MLSFSSLRPPPPKLTLHRLSALSPPQPPPRQSLFVSLTPITLSFPTSLRIRSSSSSSFSTIITTTETDSLNPTQMPPLSRHHHLKIAIIGFGNYGQFLAKTFFSQGHTLLAYSRSDHSLAAQSLGVSFFDDPHDLCEQHPDVILLCTSIISTEKVLKSLPLQRLKRNTLFVDVLSVKEFPKNLLLNVLPNDFDIICTHPMFGPESAKKGWDNLYFVYENVRIGNDESRVNRCKQFLDVFARQGCKMVEMSCQEHDKYAAESQFITHTVGRVLEMLKLEHTPISTKGYETLLDLVENTARDSFDLYYGLFMYNKNALEMLERLDLAFEALRKQLFGRLHEVVRKQLFGNGAREGNYGNGQQNGTALASASKTVR